MTTKQKSTKAQQLKRRDVEIPESVRPILRTTTLESVNGKYEVVLRVGDRTYAGALEIGIWLAATCSEVRDAQRVDDPVDESQVAMKAWARACENASDDCARAVSDFLHDAEDGPHLPEPSI
jgi:hypothetical protein